MAESVQVTDDLQELVSKLMEAQNKVNEALTIYAGVFEDLCENGYEGTASESLQAYYTFICAHIQSLAELYGKISTYINYVHEEMNEFDNALSELIGAGFSKLTAGGGN